MVFYTAGNVVFVPCEYSPTKAIEQILRRAEAISDERPKLLTVVMPTLSEFHWFVFDRDMEANMLSTGNKGSA